MLKDKVCLKIDSTNKTTRIFVPDKSKFKCWEDVLDYLIALGIKVTVEDGMSINGVDLEIIKKYSK